LPTTARRFNIERKWPLFRPTAPLRECREEGRRSNQNAPAKKREERMTTLPIVAILTAAVSLGGYNLFLRQRGIRKPVLIGVHLLFGLGALEVLIYFLKDANGGEGQPAGSFGNVAAAFLALAAFSGLLAPILGRRSRLTSNVLMATHASCGIAGFLTALAWVSRL
jgi:hypothetical protein